MSKKRQLPSVESYKSHAAEEVLKVALEELGWKNVNLHKFYIIRIILLVLY